MNTAQKMLISQYIVYVEGFLSEGVWQTLNSLKA